MTTVYNSNLTVDCLWRFEYWSVARLLLKTQPFVLSRLVALFLYLGLVSQFERFYFLALSLSWFIGVVFSAAQIFWQFEFSNLHNFRLGLSLSLYPLLALPLVLWYLFLRYSNVVEWNNLGMIKLQKLDSKPDLSASHVSSWKLFRFVRWKSLFDGAFVPHTGTRIDSHTHSIDVK